MNITEFAAYAGVSKAAVSRYFNGGYLSDEKRQAIQKAVEETGYHPSESARSIRTHRTGLIGVILPKLSSESCARVTEGISQVTVQEGYQLLLGVTANNPAKEVEYLSLFKQRQVAGIIGGVAGGLVAGLLHVGASAYGITGVFGVLITTANLWQYLLVMAVAFAVAFLMTMVLYREKKPAAEGPSTGTAAPVPVGALADPNAILSPLSGTVVALKDVPDATFAEGVLGDGIAVEPSEGKVVAPCKGTVSTLFDTHHAIGLTLENGAELLVHIGINTVELNGEGYSAFVEEGDEVFPGQTLLTFDPDFLRSKGYQTVTPVIVTNSDEYSAITPKAQGQVQAMAPLLELGDRSE